jgi:nucleoside-diphosphate-sugar epimerase
MGAFTEDQLILITGASGFIGSHLTHTLLASSPPVRLHLLARPSSDLRQYEVVSVKRWKSAEVIFPGELIS